jgi:hypothetical protein
MNQPTFAGARILAPMCDGRRKRVLGIGLVGLLLVLNVAPGDAQAAIIALFNFNDMSGNNNGTTAVTVDNAVGVPTLQLVEESGTLVDPNGQAGVSFTDQAGTNHSAGMAAAWTSGVLNASTDPNDTWLLSADTTGYSDLMLRFDYRLTSAIVSGEDLQGPTQLIIDWRQGGGSFTTIQAFNLIKDNSYHAFVLDLSGIAAIQNVADVQIRGTWSNNATESVPGGTFPSARFDNLELSGVPEPTWIALLTLGTAAIILRRHQREGWK